LSQNLVTLNISLKNSQRSNQIQSHFFSWNKHRFIHFSPYWSQIPQVDKNLASSFQLTSNTADDGNRVTRNF